MIDCVSIDIGEDLVSDLPWKTEQWRVGGIGNAAEHPVSYVCSYQDGKLTSCRENRDCEGDLEEGLGGGLEEHLEEHSEELLEERLAERAELDDLAGEELQAELQPDPGVLWSIPS